MTSLGYIKRMSPDNFHSQNRGGKGIKGMQTIDEDYIADLIMTTTHHTVNFFTNTGRVYKLKTWQIPEAGRTARGIAIVNLLQLMPGEKVSAIIPVNEYDSDGFLLMATKKGMVKKTPISEYDNIRKTGLAAITLKEEDELIEVKTTDNSKDVILVSKKGQCILFSEKNVRKTGRTSMGVRGMRLSGNDEVVGMQLTTQGEALLTISEFGMGKRTMMSEFKKQNRGGKGIRCYKVTEKTGDLIGAKLVNDEREILLITNEGIIIRLAVSNISVIGRNTSGVKLMDIDRDSEIRVAGIAKVRESSQSLEEENEDNREEDPEAEDNNAETEEGETGKSEDENAGTENDKTENPGTDNPGTDDPEKE